MPNLKLVNNLQLQTVAKRWQREHPESDPAEIDVPTRLASFKARAAFCFSQRIEWACRTGRPPPSMCATCGIPTFSWCEGCYSRVSDTARDTFAGLCRDCDAAHRVCHDCFAQGHHWERGTPCLSGHQWSRGP